jgi:tetratricopeptide (TPR) repeat protein
MSAIQGGRPEEAERLAQGVLSSNPSQPNAQHLFGYALLIQDRASEAIEPLKKAFRSLRDPAIETQLAIALRKAGQVEEAVNRLRSAAKRKPIFLAAVHELAFTLHSLGRYDDAIDTANRGIDALPGMVELRLLLGWMFHDRNDLSKAKEAFSRAIAVAPHHADTHFRMGLVLMDSGDFNSAATFFSRALALNPNNNLDVRLKLAQCLLENGQADAAYAGLRAATRFDPQVYGDAIKTLVKSARGRFWLRPSAAARFFRGARN